MLSCLSGPSARSVSQPLPRNARSALRRAAEQAEAEFQERRERQLRYLETLDEHLDLDVLRSNEMWR